MKLEYKLTGHSLLFHDFYINHNDYMILSSFVLYAWEEKSIKFTDSIPKSGTPYGVVFIIEHNSIMRVKQW